MSEPAAMRPAATILMLRDDPSTKELEVFMVVRHHQIDFASGALVFPGGKVDEGDHSPAIRGLCDGADGLNDEELGFRVAAIRESFEECGVLLAREESGGPLVSGERVAALDDLRAPMNDGKIELVDFLHEQKLVLACDLMKPFAHWITPKMMPKRFDTHFFVAIAPEDHVAVHDGSESVDSVWINPGTALKEAEAGKRTIIFPTRMNLKKLSESQNAEDAMAAADKLRGRIVTVEPWVEDRDGETFLCIPEEAGYGVTALPFKEVGA